MFWPTILRPDASGLHIVDSCDDADGINDAVGVDVAFRQHLDRVTSFVVRRRRGESIVDRAVGPLGRFEHDL